MPAVDNRGYPIKGACDLEDVGLVSVFDSLASPQPGTPLLCVPGLLYTIFDTLAGITRIRLQTLVQRLCSKVWPDVLFRLGLLQQVCAYS